MEEFYIEKSVMKQLNEEKHIHNSKQVQTLI